MYLKFRRDAQVCGGGCYDRCIERGLQIKESYKSYVTVVQSTHDVIHNFENGRLGTVSCTVGRMRGREEIVGGEVDRQVREDDFCSDFRQVRDRPVVFLTVLVK